MRTIEGSGLDFSDFDAACADAGMHRTEACHPEEPHKHCRSDQWQGDLMSFAMSLSVKQFDRHCRPVPAKEDSSQPGWLPTWNDLLWALRSWEGHEVLVNHTDHGTWQVLLNRVSVGEHENLAQAVRNAMDALRGHDVPDGPKVELQRMG